MSDHEPDQGTASARDRLLAAALLMLFERGYRGATSREIAHAAQVNEVTLFRLFSTKDDLLAAAIALRAEQDRRLVPTPTGDLAADLEALAEMVVRSLNEGRYHLLRILPEITRLPEKQQQVVFQALDETQEAFVGLFRHYQRLGELTAETGEALWGTFVGPMLIALHFAEFRQRPIQFDIPQHVRLFLYGSSTKKQQ